MIPLDLVQLGRVQAEGFRLEGEPGKATVSEMIVADVKALEENDPPGFGHKFESLRADLHRHGRSLPSTSFRAAAAASTVVGDFAGR